MSLETQLQSLIAKQGADLKFLLPGPTATDSFALNYDGTDYSWKPAPKVVKATADFDINSNVLVDFPGVALPILAGQTWKFDITVYALSLNATADLRFNVIGDATGRYGVVNGENAVSKSDDINTATTNIAVATGNATNADTIMIHGIATANNDTSLQLQVRNNAGTTVQSFSEFTNIEGVFIS